MSEADGGGSSEAMQVLYPRPRMGAQELTPKAAPRAATRLVKSFQRKEMVSFFIVVEGF